MIEDVEMITKESASTGSDYKKFTPLSDVDETIIRETELDTLIFGDDLSETYDKSGLWSKKRKRDVDIYEYNFSVSVAWKKNVAGFSFRAAIVINKSFLGKPI